MAVRSRVFILCIVSAALAGAAVAAQQSDSSQQTSSSTKKTTTHNKPASTASKPATAGKKSTTAGGKSTSTARKKAAAAKKKHVTPIRVQRVRRAFVASADLKPMARQLLQDRTPAGYAGVEKYARTHHDEAGSLSWLVAGYAHVLDHQYAAAIEPLKSARTHAGELGDYVDYYLGEAYANSNDAAHAVATLEGFQTKYPDSLLARDAMVVYAGALVSTGQEKQAISLLEAQRLPTRADLELTLGRAYSAAGSR